MYERPQLRRYGTLRELTQAGIHGTEDPLGILIASVDGNLRCDLLGRSCS